MPNDVVESDLERGISELRQLYCGKLTHGSYVTQHITNKCVP